VSISSVSTGAGRELVLRRLMVATQLRIEVRSTGAGSRRGLHVYLHGGQKLWVLRRWHPLYWTEPGVRPWTLDGEEVFTRDWIPVRWWRRAIRTVPIWKAWVAANR